MLQPVKDDGLVRAGAEGLTDAEDEHGQKQRRHRVGEAKCEEGNHVGHVRADHRPAASCHIGHGTCWDFQQVDANLTKPQEQADGKKRKPFVQKSEQKERLEVALVLQEAVQTETKQHSAAHSSDLRP